MVSVKLSAHALRDLEEIDQIVSKRILEKLAWLEQNFVTIVPERLHRELRNSYKLRIGNYRAVYAIHGNIVTVEMIGHRRDVYK
ncbi:hypothetical protein A2609_01085 [Candidatus Kaiserbacteria bacterium RIFOXYD1_FULL_47_14]|uniref:Addiction module antitoxin RelB n=1 Tax=Candidatus Kaiserbacteria bacterium RIFOXYD1_FULL_47_14 TaxID=1798533 RepID=A0A1F6G6U2_9BACT|nr:MAG: hypothetical protein A2609_01085 [Candidatus Kaiserbacteria bacterium RIFOXYD1_FULL_47_14]